MADFLNSGPPEHMGGGSLNWASSLPTLLPEHSGACPRLATPLGLHFRDARGHDSSVSSDTSSPDPLWESQDCPLPQKPNPGPKNLRFPSLPVL